MDFVALVLFLMMYYIRPQEWFGILGSLHPIQLISLLAVYSLITREKSIKPGDLFKTPHDWMMFAYFAWTVFASPTPWATFSSIQSVIIFYIVGVQALSTLPRQISFLKWWAVMILLVSALAVASQYGFDPLNSYDKTNGGMKGRLILNLSIFNNPNGLGHSVVPVIPMLFFLLFWKRLFMKSWILIMILPLYCIFLTQSKGAFLCGFVTVLATLTFGRPKSVQVLILLLGIGFGYSALYQLPRMQELNKSKSDQAISGRREAFKFGLQCMRTHTFGIGLSTFSSRFFQDGPLEYPEHAKQRTIMLGGVEVRKTLPKVGHHYYKATHSAYNQNGAELGYTGLFLFVGILYCCMRTLMMAKTADVEEERVRRMLFAIVVSYATSSWMVDFAYRPTFFLFVSATAAFHRLLLRTPNPTEKEQPAALPIPAWRKPFTLEPVASMAVPASAGRFFTPPGKAFPTPVTDTVVEAKALPAMSWRRLGILDLLLTGALTWAVIRYWEYLIQHI